MLVDLNRLTNFTDLETYTSVPIWCNGFIPNIEYIISSLLQNLITVTT